MDNPFRIEGIVRPPHFTDREKELERMEATMERPGALWAGTGGIFRASCPGASG